LTVTNTHVGGRGRPQSDSTYGEITQSFLVILDVKLLRLSCRSSACGLRRVPALLVFYSSFGSQNTVQCIKIPLIVSKLKGKTMFSVTLYMLRQALCHLASPCSFHFPILSYSDVVQALSYFASTVLLMPASTQWYQFLSAFLIV
jgi:hypothetical protein